MRERGFVFLDLRPATGQRAASPQGLRNTLLKTRFDAVSDRIEIGLKQSSVDVEGHLNRAVTGIDWAAFTLVECSVSKPFVSVGLFSASGWGRVLADLSDTSRHRATCQGGSWVRAAVKVRSHHLRVLAIRSLGGGL